MTLSVFFAIVVGAGLLGVGAATLAISRRQNKDYEKLAKTETFHCLRCDCVYTAESGSDAQPCPNCGYKNTKLRF